MTRLRPPAHRRGTIAVGMLLIMLVTHLILLTMIRRSALDTDLQVHRVQTARAFYAAESGMNLAVRELMVMADEDGDGGTGTISNDGDATNDPTIGAAAAVFVASQPVGADTLLTSQGRAVSAAEIEALLE